MYFPMFMFSATEPVDYGVLFRYVGVIGIKILNLSIAVLIKEKKCFLGKDLRGRRKKIGQLRERHK